MTISGKISGALITMLLVVGCSKNNNEHEATEQKNEDAYQQNIHYTAFDNAIDDVLIENPEIAEYNVVEFFTYGCIHCQNFAPALSEWTSQYKQTSILYVPVIWNEMTDLHARVFYLVKPLQDFKKLHRDLFHLIAGFSRTDTLEEQKITLIAWLQEKGVQPIAALNAFNRSDLEQELALSVLLAKRFNVKGTPTLVINNKFRINNNAVSDFQEVLKVANALLIQ
jgi:thiol:disulfide interchange protein DsbA